MDKRLLCVKAYYQIKGTARELGIHTRFFNLPIITRANCDILEMYIMDLEEMGYTDVCLMLMNHDLEILDTIEY